MTDLELTEATALAMGFTILYNRSVGDTPYLDCEDRSGKRVYMIWSPLKSDEQCMALVKKFRLTVATERGSDRWMVGPPPHMYESANSDLNRAIVECVAKMTRTQ